MPAFNYKGRSKNGKLTEGEMDSTSSGALAGLLIEKGITPLHISEIKKKVDIIDQINQKLDLYKVSIEELLMFTRQMGALAKAGIPITRAISGIKESIQNPLMTKALQDTLEQLESGRSLSIAFARHPRVFSNLFISMIQVGENTGRLDEAFLLMAAYIDRNRKMSNNISAALRYPTTVIIAITIAMAIVNLFVIPKFASFFEANNLDLPWQTVFLLTTSNFMVDNWHFLLVGLVLIYVLFKRYISTVEGRYKWHHFILKIPIIGDILLRAYLARFARSFAMAYGAGVPIVQGMGVISRSVGNDFIAKHVADMREGIERGEALTITANRTGMFTPVVMQMFAVGEEAGNLDEMMSFIADFYEEEVDYDVKTLSDRLEPIIYVFVGIMVLVLALGIFVPMWDIAQLAGR
ncbi:MAG: type II secretion system F family protein [Gammaproteobacteria bacterium]|jgi:MSHA biogenesis protein MshG|nr:type II secretion system F family protein [Gammaproteobacteria bacterium]MBT3723896.1 type II secretion system F family protein [Gammaproteobacteria bacterium]MBT4077390.1 type II secretion system F family protein [Gammaproteobacteria bacterium]MBT4194261.1 type II secretion system F family protein [Gammaproteobacteria bacterium]MBT4451631.1 type II secretion system F family protein [Gammaproteobacteria bacterium]